MLTLQFLSKLQALMPIVLRAAIGYGFFLVHGLQKLTAEATWESWDWGQAWVAKMSGSAPDILLYVAAYTEFFAGFALLVGLLTRWACLGLLCVMGYAIFKVHAGDPYKEFELAVVYSAALVALLANGPGPASLDRLFFGKKGIE